MRPRDDAVSTVIGTIVILAILSTALVYVNAFHVPRQGANLETQGSERTEAALLALAVELQSQPRGPSLQEVPLQAERASPPLLSGIVLSPALAPGSASIDAGAPRLTLTAELDAPADGVPANDPIREDLGNGRMRLYLLGNTTDGLATGAVEARVGGAYTSPTSYRVEAGLVLANRSDGSAALAAPNIQVQRQSVTSVAWRVPLLAGASEEIAGSASAQLALRPGPESELGGGRAYAATLRVETDNLAAWRVALEETFGSAAVITVAPNADGSHGVVEASIQPPSGTPATTRGVELRLWAVRHEVSLAQRT